MDLAEAVKRFHEIESFVRNNGQAFGLTRLKYFSTWFREPHYCPEYRQHRELEVRLNGGVDYSAGYQLLSVWRLAHDDSYAAWAGSIGTKKCQIALFGLEETNDWFCRRKGAHRDIITATLRLIEVGIQPRWMVFLNKRGLSELRGILDLVERLDLYQRVSRSGSSFELFLNDPTPIGEAELVQDLRLTAEDIASIPPPLIASTEKYMGKRFRLRTESDWIEEILSEPDRPIGLDYPKELWFFVTSDWSVYPNVGTLEPWWRLGNLLTDGVKTTLSTFLQDGAKALRAGKELSLHQGARMFGDPKGQCAYLARTDLQQMWLERYSRGKLPAGVASR